MIEAPGIAIREISCAAGRHPLERLAGEAVAGLSDTEGIGGVVAATFSNPVRFPSLAVSIASQLKLPSSVPAFDLQMACSAFPYALWTAGRLAADLGKRILVVDGDAQTPLVDPGDHATGAIFSDAAAAAIVETDPSFKSRFAFLSSLSGALSCPAEGPVFMDGFKVFSFVATEIVAFLRPFGKDFDIFAPHQANPYMVRQLARSLGLEGVLAAIDEKYKNPGSCSVAMALASCGKRGKALVAGFGAGFSASAATILVAEDFKAGIADV